MQDVNRVFVFISVLFLMLLWEYYYPKIKTSNKLKRDITNIYLSILSTIIVYLLFPLIATHVAHKVTQKGWGILNYFDCSSLLLHISGYLILDLAIYFQHRIFHKLNIFWKFHRVHLSDIGFDTTTGVSFHPVEICFSMCIKMLVVFTFGISFQSVLIFEILLNASSLFNHGNICFSKNIDRFIRLIIVTPDMHRIHHSVKKDEYNKNFSFTTSLWDRVFKTYKDSTREPQNEMTMGLQSFRLDHE